MPKCSCAGNGCSCAIQVGDGLTVTGTGSATNPFVVSLASPIVTVNQTATGVADLSTAQSGSLVLLNLSAAVTGITLPTTVGTRIDVVVKQITAGNAVTWPAAIKWPGGTAPTVSSTINYQDWFVLRSTAAGTWVGGTMGAAIR